jgi:hypothetical protein
MFTIFQRISSYHLHLAANACLARFVALGYPEWFLESIFNGLHLDNKERMNGDEGIFSRHQGHQV